MYCIKCGVKLADTEYSCPLCGTRVFHPELSREQTPALYPHSRYPAPLENSKAVQIVLTTLALMALLITVVCDLQLHGSITWSGYVAGALVIGYIALVLPFWFRRPNPVIFVPVSFVAVVIYLLYINYVTNGDWFLSLAFPVAGYMALVVTAVTALLKYVRRGILYIFGGAWIALGAMMPMMEFLICVTFSHVTFIGWSFYPMIVLVLLGGMLIFLAIHRPARETMEQKFFI